AHLCREAARGREDPRGLQYPEGVDPALGAPAAWWDADLRQDPDWEDDHVGGGGLRHHRQREGKDSGQGRHPTGPAASHLCREATGGWSHPCGLQYPKGVYPPPCPPSSWWRFLRKLGSVPSLWMGLCLAI
ncbi:hypothetical protein TorRG33x02_024060, partial [Trema orientale]